MIVSNKELHEGRILTITFIHWKAKNKVKYAWKVLSWIISVNSYTVQWRISWERFKVHMNGHVFTREHDDVIKWKHFPRYWPFVRGIHRSRWIPHTKASDAELRCFLWSAPDKRLSKRPWGWWFETPSWSLWRQCNENDDAPMAAKCGSSIRFIFQRCTFKHKKYKLHNHICTWIMQDDTLLALAREAEARRAGNRCSWYVVKTWD